MPPDSAGNKTNANVQAYLNQHRDAQIERAGRIDDARQLVAKARRRHVEATEELDGATALLATLSGEAGDADATGEPNADARAEGGDGPDPTTYGLGLLVEEIGEVTYLIGLLREPTTTHQGTATAELDDRGVADPITGQVNREATLRGSLTTECGDLLAAVCYCVARGIVDHGAVEAARTRHLLGNASRFRDSIALEAVGAGSQPRSLDMLIGPMGRCAQVVGKALRFGLDVPGARDATTGEVIPELTPRIALVEALGLAMAHLDHCAETGAVTRDGMTARRTTKLRKLLSPASRDNNGRRLAP